MAYPLLPWQRRPKPPPRPAPPPVLVVEPALPSQLFDEFDDLPLGGNPGEFTAGVAPAETTVAASVALPEPDWEAELAEQGLQMGDALAAGALPDWTPGPGAIEVMYDQARQAGEIDDLPPWQPQAPAWVPAAPVGGFVPPEVDWRAEEAEARRNR